MTTTVLIADDQAMVRTGFRMILSAEPDIEVVGEAVDGVEAVAMARDLAPDVVLMDIRMPRLDGLGALRRISGPKVVVVTTFDDDDHVREALRHGASGFVLKTSGATLLVEAIRAAASGEALVSPAITVRLLRELAGRRREPRAVPLSPRELDVVLLVARGHTNAEVAHTLHVTVGTVKTHLAAVQAKLGARNRVEIAAWAWESGLLDARD
ncbi:MULTISPECIES: response regulator [Saccharothrix]|uniref:DNA-binding response regulator n=1 Tax=Saccharothrix yanglingensis TaxID=659496 RepID=A0ABU0X6V1_9PSEU|nr:MULTISPECIES: response regulator transcription factor [Saccharothrix]MBY8848517.1 response regulator transcription factor [Saccharothrix sp. MB29]MDQ2587857.1 DNA-binding response regulator [Saccharothrix yanglingensis]MDU0292340.1 response regulator transcription factor [Saccharothrix longispora]